MFGKSSKAARELSQLFQDRSVEKEYSLIVRGHLKEAVEWDDPLIERLDRISDKKAQTSKPAQPATTNFRPLRLWEIPFANNRYPTSRYALVQAKPLTGRKHQIRRHCNHMSHPIIGDTTHGDTRHNHFFQEEFGIGRLLLAATEIRFQHPFTNAQIAVQASPGVEFDRAIQLLEELNM